MADLAKQAAPPVKNPWPLPPFEEVIRARIAGSIEGQLTINTLTWRIDGIALTNGKRTHADALMALLEGVGGLFPAYYNATSQDWTHTFTIVDFPTQSTFAPVHYGMINKGGVVAAGHCPTQSAVVINKKSTHKGKHGRGRISVPAVPLIWVTGTTLNLLTEYLVLASIMGSTLTDGTNTFAPGIYGVNMKLTPIMEGWVDIVEVLVNPILGTIRRRRPGVGK